MTHRKKPTVILMAEDDPDDRMFSKDALEEANLPISLEVVEDGTELMDYLFNRGRYEDPHSCPLPGLILLDLNMPKKDGREALQEIKADPRLRHIPVIVLTTSRAEEDILKSYDLGVSGYITKPVTYQRLINIMRVIGEYWFEVVELPKPVKGDRK